MDKEREDAEAAESSRGGPECPPSPAESSRGGPECPPSPASPESAEARATVAAEEEADALKRQWEEEKSKAEKHLSNWQRAEADLANFKRRAEQERGELQRFANAALIARLLPVLDDFERAIAAIPEKDRSLGWVEGIRLIEKKLRSALEQEGVSAIDAVGVPFDPHVHEAVMREEGEGDLDVVVEELQRGYRLHDRVLRPSMVKVGRGSDKVNPALQGRDQE